MDRSVTCKKNSYILVSDVSGVTLVIQYMLPEVFYYRGKLSEKEWQRKVAAVYLYRSDFNLRFVKF